MRSKELRKREFCALLISSMMIVGLFTLSAAFSSFMISVVISNTGKISLFEVTAKSGSPEDIQAAVNSVQAVGGGTVRVPAGTYNWNGETVNIPGGVNIIGAGNAGCDGHPTWAEYTASTILHNTQPSPFNTMFIVDGTNGKRTRISGIRFEGTVTDVNVESGVAIELRQAIDFRVDHCTFINIPGTSVFVTNAYTGTTRGVIDHCVIDNPYKDTVGGIWGYGVYAQGHYRYWDTDITKFLGKYETAPANYPIMYVEDCHFSRCRHAVDGIQGAWDVARYNLMDEERPKNFGSIDMHGSMESDIMTGVRGLEAYYNTIICPPPPWYGGGQPMTIRGGGGVIFGNTMTNVYIGIGLFNEDPNDYLPYTQVHDLYIWNNTCDAGTMIGNQGGYTENTDYFLRAPNQAQDGFTYTPYPYPHPLTTH